MKTFAVIDIGSNSVRLMLLADGNVLYKRLETTRLGEDIAKTVCIYIVLLLAFSHRRVELFTPYTC